MIHSSSFTQIQHINMPPPNVVSLLSSSDDESTPARPIPRPITTNSPLMITPRTDSSYDEPIPWRTPVKRQRPDRRDDSSSGSDEETSLKVGDSFESAAFFHCPVVGCKDKLSRKTFYMHVVATHHCDKSGYLRDLREALKNRGTYPTTLCGIELGGERYFFLSSLRFLDKGKKQEWTVDALTNYNRRFDEDLKPSMLSVWSRSKGGDMHKLLPSRGNRASIWDILCMGVIEAKELSFESRLRFSRCLWFVGKVICELGDPSFTTLDKVVDKLETIQTDSNALVKLRHLVETNLRTCNHWILVDTDYPGSYFENCLLAVSSAASFIKRFVVSLRKA